MGNHLPCIRKSTGLELGSSGILFFFFNIYLAVLGLSCSTRDLRSFLQHARSFRCSMWDLVPWSGMEPGPPVLGAQSLSHWTTREVSVVLEFWSWFCYCFLILPLWALVFTFVELIMLSVLWGQYKKHVGNCSENIKALCNKQAWFGACYVFELHNHN